MKNVMKTTFGKVVILEGALKAMLCKNFGLKSLDYMLYVQNQNIEDFAYQVT